jgi:tetratricopeptide (TPR) repeat protein
MTRIIALILAVFAASPSHAQTTVKGADIVRASAAALVAGDAVRAAQLAEVILAVKPNDLEALILRARAALALEDFETAKALSKRAYRATDNGAVKFSTARVAAVAHANAGEDTRAQLWLRRARQFAPDEERSNQVAQEFQVLARRNPWTTNLQFGITPSSNVNGGSTEDTLFSPLVALFNGTGISNISVDGRDLPGLEITGGLQSSYRLNASENSATFLSFGANVRRVVLQQSAIDEENAKERARVEQEAAEATVELARLEAEIAALPEGEPIPDDLRNARALASSASRRVYTDQDVSGREFSSAAISAGILHRRILQDGWDPTTFRLDLNRTWYAGDPLSWRYTASVGQTVPISDQLRLNFRVAASGREVFARNDSARYSVDSNDARVGLTYRLANRDQISVSFDVKDSRSSNANNDYDQRGLYADYAFGRSFAGVQLGIGVGISERDYGFDGIVGLDRTDDIYTLNARARLTEIEYYGFQPEISLNASRTNSVNPRFDTDTLRIGFDLRSSF